MSPSEEILCRGRFGHLSRYRRKPSLSSLHQNPKEVVLFTNPDFDLASTPMLAKADDSFSDPGSKSIRVSEKRDVEDWNFDSEG
jgi:hypothetical protein